MAAAKEAATKDPQKDAEKPAAPPVNHDEIIAAVSEGLFTATVPRKSHTRFEVDGKQVVYGEKRKGGLAIVMSSKLIEDPQIAQLVTPQPWHGGRSVLMVGETKKDIAAARRVLKHVIANYHAANKAAEEHKAQTIEQRKAKQAADRAEKRAAREAAKAQAEAEAATEADEATNNDEEEDEYEDEEDE